VNHTQILEQLLNFSLQQHVIKDQTIEGLQKRVAELEKQLADRPTVLQTAN
jgi:hypothetical protein